YRHLTPELLARHGREATYRGPVGNVAYDAATGGDPGAAPDRQVTGKPALPADHDEVAELGASRYPDLRHDDATPADRHVVPDLDQIINHRTVADDRVRPGAAVDRRIGADLDIIADDDAAELRHAHMAGRIGREAEAVLADARAWKDRRPRADDGVADGDVGA